MRHRLLNFTVAAFALSASWIAHGTVTDLKNLIPKLEQFLKGNTFSCSDQAVYVQNNARTVCDATSGACNLMTAPAGRQVLSILNCGAHFDVHFFDGQISKQVSGLTVASFAKGIEIASKGVLFAGDMNIMTRPFSPGEYPQSTTDWFALSSSSYEIQSIDTVMYASDVSSARPAMSVKGKVALRFPFAQGKSLTVPFEMIFGNAASRLEQLLEFRLDGQTIVKLYPR